MSLKFEDYNAVLFDFDGVIANSNFLKENVFIEIFERIFNMSKHAAQDYLKIQHGHNRTQIFSDLIIKTHENDKISINDLLKEFSLQVSQGLLNVESCKNLDRLYHSNPEAFWGIVTAGDADEIINFLNNRTNFKFLHKNVFDGTFNKEYHIKNLLDSKHIFYPILYFGDSLVDYELAKEFDLDFVYISKWGRTPLDLSFNDYPYLEYATLDDFVKENVY